MGTIVSDCQKAVYGTMMGIMGRKPVIPIMPHDSCGVMDYYGWHHICSYSSASFSYVVAVYLTFSHDMNSGNTDSLAHLTQCNYAIQFEHAGGAVELPTTADPWEHGEMRSR